MKTFLITGATSGIGEACARQCLAQGDQVVALCRNLEKAQSKFGPEIAAGTFVPLQYDLGHNADLFDFCLEHLKPYTIERCIHCAGFTVVQKLTSTNYDTLQKMFETHVFSLAEMVRALLRLRKVDHELSIVAVSSVASHALSMSTGAYCMAKASMDYYVRFVNKLINSGKQKRLPPPAHLLAQAEAIADPVERERAIFMAKAQSGLMLRINAYNPSSIETAIFDYDFAKDQGIMLPLIPMDVVVEGIFDLLENQYISGQSIVVNNDAAY